MASLADAKTPRTRGKLEHLRVDERIIENQIGLLKTPHRFEGEKLGITRSRSNE
tara:strand:- start:342 stop:503 length:162 start_codon:yes stop_codon:yes gene_type:complete